MKQQLSFALTAMFSAYCLFAVGAQAGEAPPHSLESAYGFLIGRWTVSRSDLTHASDHGLFGRSARRA